MSDTQNMHGTGLVLGKWGLMLRGPSGAGKSLLALCLLDAWEARSEAAKLVADDRLDLLAARGGLTMQAPAGIAGLIELRGRGIVSRPYTASARLHLVVDLVDDLPRMVEEDELRTELLGIELARCPVPRFGVTQFGHQVLLVREALAALASAKRPARQKAT